VLLVVLLKLEHGESVTDELDEDEDEAVLGLSEHSELEEVEFSGVSDMVDE